MCKLLYEPAELESALMDANFMAELTHAFVRRAMDFDRTDTLAITAHDRELAAFAIGHTSRLISEAQAIFNGKPTAKLGGET